MAKEKFAACPALIAEVEKRFLAGEKLCEVKEFYRETNVPLSCLNPIRISLFRRMQSDPKILSALANGPLLNPNRIVRYTGMRRALKTKIAVQMDIEDNLGAAT